MSYVLAHFIGDYILQNDRMAVNKKKNTYICLLHAMLYVVPFVLTSLTFLQITLVFLQHFIQDRTTFVAWFCRKTGKFQSEIGQSTLPWGHFIVDNIFHIIWIVFVTTYLKF